jgi:lipopolysaccharide assembly outer membrane protein LptD (OstA)
MILLTSLFLAPFFLLNSSKISATKLKTDLPLIELVKFRYLEIDANGSNKVVLGALGYHFKDLEKIIGLEFFQKDGSKIENFSALNAQKRGEIVSFDGKIVCKNAKDDRISAEKAIYNTNDKSLMVESKFQLESKSYIVNGENLKLWDENKKLSAERINAKFFTENR